MAVIDLGMGQLVYLAQASFAMVLGGLIGWERDRSGKPAGLRTHMLVAGSASLLVSLSHIGIGVFEAQLGRQIAGGDPIRVIQTIITGFSVVGAGTIIGAQRHVLGLTTAASILFVATVGICVGMGQVLLATGATAVGLVVLHLLGAFEHRYWRNDDDPPTDP
ncbi:MgtC/SapB family protein [Candidatus Poribacteria bacterium]|jgi:putative Mg2+ transporter-C (MgtC) family protein|nr:MgtC/SapB family protein [Candidatus Poribacteria bacterium]MBT5532508.1 MgtC/SapB family protein [Candidatus Poribacteria bacterium]MBT5711750.1 MgtC/SapB family protein [Candidatus Poribacteria bacterium]MBT7100394.1 MgtC/SapB family protein [Candidatus Poribacteria bacterium]MBT7808629.1 MgtC/SapB family protein [Candidatus Poribacteria bacterium]